MYLTQSIFRTCSALLVWVVGLGMGIPATVFAQTNPPAQAVANETDPIVISVRASNPTTAPELARAVRMMLDISRDDLALQYIGQLAQLKIDDEQWFNLMREYGSEFVLRLAGYSGVQPAGRQLAETILVASNRFAHDPARLEQLTRLVADPRLVQRSEALEDLQALGDVGAAALLNALADEGRVADQDLLRAAIASFGPASAEPILGGIRSPQPRLRLESVRAARYLDSSEAALALFRPAWADDSPEDVRSVARDSLKRVMGMLPDPPQAARVLKASIDQRLSNDSPLGQGELAPKTIWRTHPQNQTLVEMKRSWLVVQRIEAAERAEDLIKIQPDSGSNQRLYALALLEATKYLRGFEGNLGAADDMAFARNAGPEFMEKVLEEALRRDLVGAASGACEILGVIGDQKLLRGATIRPLVAATSSDDRRVQFAACEAIMAINPTSSFPGSSTVAQSIMSLAQSRGRAKVLVGHNNVASAQNLADTIKLLGFDSVAVSQGQELFRRATEDPDIEFVIMSDGLGTPTYQDLIYRLRNDPRSRHLPIALQLKNEPIDIAWQNDVARSYVQIYLVIDTRQFENYDDWLRRTRDVNALRMPLLLIVKPGDTEIAFGWSASDSLVRFIELPTDTDVIAKNLPERVKDAFRLSRSPVSLVLQPRTVPGSELEVSAALVVDPRDWVRWPQWTKQLHDNEITQRIDVVRANDAGLLRVKAETPFPKEESNRLKMDELDFLYTKVSDLLSNTDSLTVSLSDAASIMRGQELELIDPLVVCMPWTLDQSLVARQMDRLVRLAKSTPVNTSQRSRYAETAMDWLASIASQPERYPFWELTSYDQRIGEIAVSREITPTICQTLGSLGTPLAQRQLANIASENQLPQEIRQAAIEALTRAIADHGILLTSEQIQLQYDRYNASEKLPEETQSILAAVLDAIERPTSATR